MRDIFVQYNGSTINGNKYCYLQSRLLARNDMIGNVQWTRDGGGGDGNSIDVSPHKIKDVARLILLSSIAWLSRVLSLKQQPTV